MPKAFAKLTASQQLARQIQRQVERGDWSAGSSLPSVRDLADYFQVSRTTVQKAMRELNDQQVIQLRERQPGVIAANPPGKRLKNQVGFVIGLDPSIHIPLWWAQQIVYHVQMALAENGYVLTLFNFMANKPGYSQQVIDQMPAASDPPAGMLLFALDELAPLVDHCEQMGLPWVSVNPMSLRTSHNFVMADQLAAGRLVGRCFAKLGYERVALIFDELQNISPLEKITGFYQGYLLEGVPTTGIRHVCCPNMEVDAAREAMRHDLDAHEPPQGIFATADTLAVGAMEVCQKLGVRVPEDLGVVGSTGLPRSVLNSTPRLTELRQPVEAIGRQLVASLMKMIGTGERHISGVRIPSPLVMKETLSVPESICRELGIDFVAEERVLDPAEPVSAARAGV